MNHPVVPPPPDGGYPPPVPGHGYDDREWPYGRDAPPYGPDVADWPTRVTGPPVTRRPDDDAAWWDDAPATEVAPAAPAEPAPPARRRNSAGRLVLHIGLAVLVALGVFALKSVLFGDPTRHAGTGDCVATGEAAPTRQRTDAKVVDCGAADARFTVAGRVDGTTGTDGPVCDRFFQPDEQFWVYSSEASGGYVLCLRPNG